LITVAVTAAVWALTMSVGPARAADEPTKAKAQERCGACHQQSEFSKEGLGQSAHADLDCRDCHQTYQFDPHKAPEEPDADAVAKYGKYSKKAPDAFAACAECHEDDLGAHGMDIPHGQPFAERKAGTPYCLDCHGNPHTIEKTTAMPPLERRRTFNARCKSCHADEEKMAAAGRDTVPVKHYEHTVHFRKLALGSDTAPGCLDCHGGHDLTGKGQAKIETCVGCHPAANEDFVKLAEHHELTAEDSPVGYYTQKMFAWLTVTTIFLLALHVLMDLLATLRAAARKND
jgi:hypothetical protein